jgi:hypothetical protein
VPETKVDHAYRLLAAGLDALAEAVGSTATDDELISALTVYEGAARRADRGVVRVVADLQRRGTFAERGYRNTTTALADLLGWDRADARRRVTAAEQIEPRIGLDGSPLPAYLPSTSEVFAAGRASLRHVDVIARLLACPAARRLLPDVWAGAEAQLAAKAGEWTPSELLDWGARLIDTLDQDGPEPDEEPKPINELHLTRHRGRPGGTLRGHYDDAELFDAIAAAVDAQSRPVDADERRTPAQRQAEALADACGYVLDHGDLPRCGGARPHLNVHIQLQDLESRGRAACLDFGGTMSPESLRMVCCDAAVIPVVLNGKGQPLDVGRLTRVVPDGLRRAVVARDRGCARCGRPPSWCEAHHLIPWEQGGVTAIETLVLLCRACHRLVHHAGWEVLLVDGIPEFYPPAWVDPRRHPRRRPPPVPNAA